MDTVLAVITASVVGLMVGVELGVAVVINPIILRLPPEASMAAGADGARMMGRAMPVWYIASVILTGGLTVLTWGSTAATAALIATVLLLVSVLISVGLLVPINNRAATWTPESHPADWREQRQRWHRLHYARVAIIVAAFVLTVIAAVTL